MRIQIIILSMLFVLAFPAAGCSSAKKDILQKEPTGAAPLQPGQKNENTLESDFIGKAAEPESREKPDERIAYITIDDGPSRNNTAAILDILKQKGVKATFFILPKNNLDDIYKRFLDEGHAIGNHSHSHAKKLYASADAFESDLLKAEAFIYKKLNYTTTVFRFPGGAKGRKKSIINKRADILKKHGYRYFDWDVSVADTDPKLKSYGDEKFVVDLMVGNVLNNSKGKKRLIVLMHDGSAKTYTVRALPRIIKGLEKQGYRFDTLTNYKE